MFSLPSVIIQSGLVKRLLFSDKVNINHGNRFAKQNLLAAVQEYVQLTTGPPKITVVKFSGGRRKNTELLRLKIKAPNGSLAQSH